MNKPPVPADNSLQTDAERERTLMEQLPQVRYIARRIHERGPRHVPLEDLIHAGVVGLIDALNKFDQLKQVKFASYAKFRIHGAIVDSLRELDWSPRTLRRKGRVVEQAHSTLSCQLGRTPNESELAHELGIELRALQSLLAQLAGLKLATLRVESPRDGSEEDLTDHVPGPPDETPFFFCLRSEMKHLLTHAISKLAKEEQRVLSLYYCDELTMKKVGEALGIGPSRVSQIHSLAVVRLRSLLNAQLQGAPPAAHGIAAKDPGERNKKTIQPGENRCDGTSNPGQPDRHSWRGHAPGGATLGHASRRTPRKPIDAGDQPAARTFLRNLTNSVGA